MAETDNLILNPGTGGSTLATDAIGSVHHQRVKVQHGADGQATDASAATPLPVAEQVQSPQHERLTSAGLTAGGNVDLTASDISGGMTGRLIGVDCGASVPLRVDIQTVSGARTTHVTVFTQAGRTVPWRPPHKDFIAQAGGAGNAFGVSITNLDTSKAADVYATPYWEES
jgi:hypothetical protein